VLKSFSPLVVNISRFAKRVGTKAAVMDGQLLEGTKKDYSREATEFCRKMFENENSKFIKKKFKVLVSEKDKKGLFIARTNSYRPVIVNGGLGEFVEIKITCSQANFFKGELL
jgi:tRNA A37 methylthiotransferase MiaB